MNHKYKVGDIVRTGCIEGCYSFSNKYAEIVYIDNRISLPYLIYVKGAKGHSGEAYIESTRIVKQKGYEGQCLWVSEEDIIKKIDVKQSNIVQEEICEQDIHNHPLIQQFESVFHEAFSEKRCD